MLPSFRIISLWPAQRRIWQASESGKLRATWIEAFDTQVALPSRVDCPQPDGYEQRGSNASSPRVGCLSL